MRQDILNKFKELFEERCNRIRLLDIGEDSVRYDFFNAIATIENLKTWDIQLEFAIDKQAFVERNNEKSKRDEKPQIDLVVMTDALRLSVEFGLFRQNSNEDGTINKTGRTVKMMNDMIRLCLDSLYTNRQSYFICVADDKMLGHQLHSKILGKFPSDYNLTKATIEKQKEIKTSEFDERFIQKFRQVDKEVKATVIYNERLKAKHISRETRIIVWEVKLS